MARVKMLGCPITSLLYLELAHYFEFNSIEIYRVLMQYCLVNAVELLIRSSMTNGVTMLVVVHEVLLAFQSMNRKLMVKLVAL